tara:strand:+ start:3620 stop:3898 length:279 start_codon:yes stop_codon:yes gene_type:complete
MSRKIIIDKYQGNTNYSVHVIDSFGQEHHLGYLGITFHTFTEIDVLAEKIWSNEVKQEIDSMSLAISNCIELDKKAGLHFTDSRGNHRDGLD